MPHRRRRRCGRCFVRSRRGLSHTHVGSLHAPDAHMALRNARDLYTRRQEGVSHLGRPRRATSSRAARTRRTPSSTRPATSPTGTRRSTRCPEGCSTCDRTDAAARRTSTSRLRTPTSPRTRCGSATTRSSSASGWASGRPLAAARGGRRAAQPRARPARPGAHPADVRRRAAGAVEGRGRTEDDLAFLRDEPDFTLRAAVRGRQRRLRPHDGPPAAGLGLPAAAVAGADRVRPTRCSPVSPARRSRRPPTTSTTRAAGSCASATAPRSRTAACRPGSTRSGPTPSSCSRATRWSSGSSPAASPSTRTCCAPPWDAHRHRRAGRGHAHGAARRPGGPAAGARAATEGFGYLLAELQHLHRTHPGARW